MILVSKFLESKDLTTGKVSLCISWFSNFGLDYLLYYIDDLETCICRLLFRRPRSTWRIHPSLLLLLPLLLLRLPRLKLPRRLPKRRARSLMTTWALVSLTKPDLDSWTVKTEAPGYSGPGPIISCQTASRWLGLTETALACWEGSANFSRACW